MMASEYDGPFSLSDVIAIYKPVDACECGSCDHNRIVDWARHTVHWVCAECAKPSIMHSYCSDENAAYFYKIYGYSKKTT
jgi:hypothetical protein